jgi:small subunit ribosomal protein S2
MAYITMKHMLETGVHFGHQTRRWNPKMRPYIFGARKGVHIIDLQQTVQLFRKAHDAISEVVARDGKVIFVGTKRQARETVASEAQRCGMFYVTNRWLGGTLTNFQTIKHRIERLKDLETMFEDGSIHRFPKKEIAGMQRELAKLQAALGGIKGLKELPQIAFVIDPKREELAVREFRKLGIPIVAVTDSNCDPDQIDYVIPGNDDAIRAIQLFVSSIADACLEGQARQDTGEGQGPSQDQGQTNEGPSKTAEQEDLTQEEA